MTETYLTTAEVARRLDMKTKRLRNLMSAGFFRESWHFFRKRGMAARWRWDRVVATIEGDVADQPQEDTVPLAESGGRRMRKWV